MSKMISRVIAKRDVQGMIKALRAAKFEVTKDDGGMYRCEAGKHGVIFQAMPGRSGYLVRMLEDLFE